MNYQSFCEQLVKSVKEQLGDKYQVNITNIEKNNGIISEGMMIRKEESGISPNIYLEYFYDKYREGESIQEVIEEVLLIYRDTIKRNPVHIEQLAKLKRHENDIFFRLVNYERNKKLLKRVPHIRYLEFAITFHCLVEKQEYGIQSFCINETIRQEWGICTEKLYQLALKNTPLLFPPKIQSMEDMMYEIFKNTKNTSTSSKKWFSTEGANDWKQYEKNLEEMLASVKDSEQTYMYVLTNEFGSYGASALLYSNVLDCFAKRIGKNFYLLPSSVHEWILVTQMEEYPPQVLKEMVQEVNYSHVAHEEILSNQVFFYNKETKQIEDIQQDRNSEYAYTTVE